MNRLFGAAASAVLLCALAAAGARGASFQGANYGQRERGSETTRITTTTVDGKSLGFTLDSTATVHVYGGTIRSRSPVSGSCGSIGASGATDTIPMTWGPRASGSRGPSRDEYDCGYSGTLSTGAYAVKVAGKFRGPRGPEVDGAGAAPFSGVTITGPLRDLRLTFVNQDAAAASITAAPLTGSGTLTVKVYEYGRRPGSKTAGPQAGNGAAAPGGAPGSGAPGNGAPGNGKAHAAFGARHAVLKAPSTDPRLAAVPLEAGATYSVIVRGSGGTAGDESSDVVLTVSALDQAPAADAPPADSTGAAPPDGGSVGTSTGTAPSPPPDEPPAGGSNGG